LRHTWHCFAPNGSGPPPPLLLVDDDEDGEDMCTLSPAQVARDTGPPPPPPHPHPLLDPTAAAASVVAAFNRALFIKTSLIVRTGDPPPLPLPPPPKSAP
jgi:hypothetical protein